MMTRRHTFIMIFMVMLLIFATVIKADDYDDDDSDDRSRRNRDNINSTENSDNTRNTDDNTRDKTIVNNDNFNNDNRNRNQDTNDNNTRLNANRVNGVRNTSNDRTDNFNVNRRDDDNAQQQQRNANQTPPNIDEVDGMRDDRTGLSFRTLNLLASLPSCQQKTLLNYRKLLRSPSIRLQFFRDLYQLQQRDYVEGCAGDDGGMVRIGAKERGILMGDKYFRRRVKFLMGKQPIGAAIRGPVVFPNDIGADQSASNTRILTITKQ